MAPRGDHRVLSVSFRIAENMKLLRFTLHEDGTADGIGNSRYRHLCKQLAASQMQHYSISSLLTFQSAA